MSRPRNFNLMPEEAEQRRRIIEVMREADRDATGLFSEQMARMDAEEDDAEMNSEIE